jgi:hypothetical protein
MRIYIALIVILFSISHGTFSQFLLLKKYRNFKFITISRGDTITYKQKGNHSVWKSGRIESISDISFTCQSDTVQIYNIAAIKIPRRNLHYKADGTILILGGIYFISISIINDLINHNDPHLTTSQLIIYPALVVTGIILRNLPVKNCKIGRRYSLQIIQSRFPK